MAEKKKRDRTIIFIILGVLAFLFLFSGGIPIGAQPGTSNDIVNEGSSIGVYVVDASGNILDSIKQDPNTLSIVTPQTGGGFLAIDSARGEFLALGVTLDNTGGTVDVTVNDLVGSNPGDATNILDSALTAVETALSLPGLLISAGTNTAEQLTSGMDIQTFAPATLAGGSVDFTIQADGTFIDSEGQSQPFSSSNFVTLNFNEELCSDNTVADPSNLDADDISFCSTQQGKYCRIDNDGNPTLTDNAGVCGCDPGFEASGSVCVASSCTAGTCIAGTIAYCLDGTNIENRCEQCGVANCPLDAQGQTADGCNPATVGVQSQCTYPAVGAESFTVSVNEGITSGPQCGDEVKNGAEVCDGLDLGGQTCTSQGFSSGTLACAVDCNSFDTSSCVVANVKFRTDSLDYGPGTSVGYTLSCGSALTGYGRTSGACTEHSCGDVDQDENVPSTSGTTKFWFNDADTVCICEDGATSGFSRRYTTADSDAGNVATSASPITPSNELSC